jgi:hypothetical protein
LDDWYNETKTSVACIGLLAAGLLLGTTQHATAQYKLDSHFKPAGNASLKPPS